MVIVWLLLIFVCLDYDLPEDLLVYLSLDGEDDSDKLM